MEELKKHKDYIWNKEWFKEFRYKSPTMFIDESFFIETDKQVLEMVNISLREKMYRSFLYESVENLPLVHPDALKEYEKKMMNDSVQCAVCKRLISNPAEFCSGYHAGRIS